MTISEGASLLTFLDAPVLVGDPDGRVIYVNPSFERRFEQMGTAVQGEQLASLFSGGAREQMLQAVADVCAKGRTVRFRLREGKRGYLALVSPIGGNGEQLGVVILLTDEPLADERVLMFHREMQEPLDELRGCLDELLEQTGGRRNEIHRVGVESGLRALERARKWSDELHGVLTGRDTLASSSGRVEVLDIVREVAARMQTELAGPGISIHLLAPGRLTAAQGDGPRLESALIQLIRERVTGASAGEVFTLSARDLAGADSVLVSLVDPPRDDVDEDSAASAEPPFLRETVEALGGRIHTSSDPKVGRVTTICLPAAE